MPQQHKADERVAEEKAEGKGGSNGCACGVFRLRSEPATTQFMLILGELKSGDTHCSSELCIFTGDKLCELKNSVLGHKYPLGES